MTIIIIIIESVILSGGSQINARKLIRPKREREVLVERSQK